MPEELEPNPKLIEALKRLPQPEVPSQVDRTIRTAARAQVRLIERRRARRRWSWVAAVLMVGLTLTVSLKTRSPDPTILAERQDVNGDGRVDILDAFALAREIRDGRTTVGLDFTGEGVVDRRDVDVLAQTAVQLTERL